MKYLRRSVCSSHFSVLFDHFVMDFNEIESHPHRKLKEVKGSPGTLLGLLLRQAGCLHYIIFTYKDAKMQIIHSNLVLNPNSY